MYHFESLRHFLMWVDWNVYANGYLCLILLWSWTLISSLMQLKVKFWQAMCNVVAVLSVWLFVCYVAYGTGLG